MRSLSAVPELDAAWQRDEENRLDERVRRYELIDPDDRLGGREYETGRMPVKEDA